MDKFGSGIRDKYLGSAILIHKFQGAIGRWCPCTMCGRRVRSTGSGSCASCACPGSTTWPPATPTSRRMRKATRQGTLSPSLCGKGSCRPGLSLVHNFQQSCGSGSGLDPGSVGSLDPDLDPEGQKLPLKIERKDNKFHFLLCWVFFFEGRRLLL